MSRYKRFRRADRDRRDLTSFALDLQTSLIPERFKGSSTPTFTRATTACRTDFEGKLNLVPSGAARMQGARYVRNFAVNSGTLTVAAGWGKTGTPTITAGQTDPDGGTTAYRISATGAGNEWYYNATAAIGTQGVSSLWIKRVTGNGAVKFLTVNGGVGTTAPLTASWQRLASAVSTSTGGNFDIGINLATSGDEVDIWHPQLEDVTGQTNQNPSEYVSVGVLSAPYHGAGVDGVKYFSTLNGNTVASNVVTEATGAAINSSEAACADGVTAGVVDASGPLGYLAEGARINRCLYSQVFSNAAWVSGGGGIAVADNSIAAPDGTTTADTLTASGANGTLIQDLGVVASAAKSGGLWLKRKTGTGDIDITLDGGSTWTTVAVTADWVRFQKTQTLADEDFGIRIVTSGDAVYAWQGQVETATFLSSDIPTTTVAVARNASVDQYVSAGNISSTATSITMEVTPAVSLTAATEYFHWASYVDASNYTAILSDGTNLIARKRIAGVNTDATIAWSRAKGTTAKVGARFDTANGIDVWLNGTKGTGSATLTASQIGTNFQISADGNSLNQDFSAHRFFNAYTTSLSDSRMGALTT